MVFTQEQILSITGLSRTHLWRLRQDGRFPEPIDPNTKPLLWRDSDVQRWVLEADDGSLSDRDRMILKRHGDAVEEAREAVRAYPISPEAYELLARAAEAAGRDDEADSARRVAAELSVAVLELPPSIAAGAGNEEPLP